MRESTSELRCDVADAVIIGAVSTSFLQKPLDGIVEMLVNDGHNPRDLLCLTVIDN